MKSTWNLSENGPWFCGTFVDGFHSSPQKYTWICVVLFFLAKTASAQGHYPLDTGNRWEYWDIFEQQYLYTISATGDTVLPNGNHYTILENTAFPDYPGYWRQSGPKVYSFYPVLGDTAETLRYDFSKTVGDTVAVNEDPYSVTVITVISDEILEVFGKPRRVWGFWAQEQNSSAYTSTKVADSVGVTWRTGEVSPYYESLVGAIINGTVYGTLSTRKDYGLSYPQEFKLFQNHPNPFNPTTTVEISIPGSGLVTLTVYDLLGREIEAILTQHMVAGHHTVQWNAQDFPSGIYFVRMQAGHFTQTKKVTVLR